MYFVIFLNAFIYCPIYLFIYVFCFSNFSSYFIAALFQLTEIIFNSFYFIYQ